MRKKTLLLQYNLQWFADGPGGEKTEPATAKRLSDARKKGQVARSTELVYAVELITLFLVLKIYVGTLGERFINFFTWIYENRLPDFVREQKDGVTVQAVTGLLNNVYLQMIITALPFMLAGFAAAFFANILQVHWKISTEPLRPKLSNFNPINGFKRIISKQALFELVKSILKIVLIFYVAYISIKDHKNELFILYDMPLNQAISLIGGVIVDTGLKISFVYLIIGLMDFFFQKHKFNKDMKMSKQEVKDEFKDSEGDPQIRGRQRQRMQEASRKRMMQAIPKADVVITNPTHLAVAIRYEAKEAKAPVVVAKGADYLAQKIKELAKENHVEIMENKPLARALYTTVDIGAEIPPELYEAVAEILAVIYGKKNKL